MKTLIYKIEEVQEYIRVGNGLSIEALRPSINEVMMHEMTYYLGEELLDKLGDHHCGEANKKILSQVRAAVACLAVYKASPEIEVLMSDNGILRQESNNEKAAYGGQVVRFRELAANRGYAAIDSFLAILEKNEEEYPEWVNSEYYSLKNGMMIRSVKEFEQAGESINGSCLTYRSLRPIMLAVQDQQIRSVLPDTMYQEIIEQLDAGELSPANEVLVNRYLAPAIAKLTIEDALSTLPVEVSHLGVNVTQVEVAGDARTIKQANIAMIEKKAWTVRGRGMYYLANMKEYLNATSSAQSYPLWYGSANYSRTLAQQIMEDGLGESVRTIYRT
jgi:hypothetical protein